MSFFDNIANGLKEQITHVAQEQMQTHGLGALSGLIPGGQPQTAPPQEHGAREYAQVEHKASGRAKALMIGINYTGSDNALKGCINDVHNVQNWLFRANPAYQQNCLVLTDDQQDPSKKPTKANMLNALHWLAQDCQPGDHLFFHYSGHGATMKDAGGDESEGTDETLVPVDFKTAGQITDDEIHSIICKPLPAGAQLISFIDCCHSGTVFDLPFTYKLDGSLEGVVVRDNKAQAFKHGTSAVMSFMKKDNAAAFKEGWQAIQTLMAPQPTPSTGSDDAAALQQKYKTAATVIQLSGCMDHQTSADATIAGQSSGALSWALLQVLAKNPNPSYLQLLKETRDLLHGKYSQVPQMSTGQLTDVANFRFQA